MWENTFTANCGWFCCFLMIQQKHLMLDSFSPHCLQYSPCHGRHSVISDKHTIICLACILKIGSCLSVETNDCVLFSDKQSILHFVTSPGAHLRHARFFLGKGLQSFAVDLIQLVFSLFKKLGVMSKNQDKHG